MKKILCCLAVSLCVLAASALPSTANSAVTGRFGTSGSGSGGSGAKSVLGVKFGMLFGGDLDSGWGAGAFYHRKIGIISLQPELILHIYDTPIYDSGIYSYYSETEGHSDLALNLLLGLSLGSPASFCLNPYAGLGFDVIDGDLMIPVGGQIFIGGFLNLDFRYIFRPDTYGEDGLLASAGLCLPL